MLEENVYKNVLKENKFQEFFWTQAGILFKILAGHGKINKRGKHVCKQNYTNHFKTSAKQYRKSLNLVCTNNSKNMKESENSALNDYFTNCAQHLNGNLLEFGDRFSGKLYIRY